MAIITWFPAILQAIVNQMLTKLQLIKCCPLRGTCPGMFEAGQAGAADRSGIDPLPVSFRKERLELLRP